MKNTDTTLLIKNMVCQRCVLAVADIFDRLQLPYQQITLGEVVTGETLSKESIKAIEYELQKIGFELIETRTNKIVETIKRLVVQFLNETSPGQKLKLSAYITNELPYDYSYLSDLFSSVEGRSIEQYFITQRIEKVKELIVYDQLSLSEIAFRTGFSSVHHLSAQFKKITGLTPSHFKSIRSEKRKSIDSI